MSWLEFVVAVLDSFPWWPAVAVAALIMLRRHVGGLLERVESWEQYGRNTKFRDIARDAREVRDLEESVATQLAEGTERDARQLIQVLGGAIRDHPRTAVLTAFRLVEDELATLRYGSLDRDESPGELLYGPDRLHDEAVREGWLSPMTAQVITYLQELRDMTVRRKVTTVRDARDFLELAGWVIEKLDTVDNDVARPDHGGS